MHKWIGEGGAGGGDKHPQEPTPAKFPPRAPCWPQLKTCQWCAAPLPWTPVSCSVPVLTDVQSPSSLRYRSPDECGISMIITTVSCIAWQKFLNHPGKKKHLSALCIDRTQQLENTHACTHAHARIMPMLFFEPLTDTRRYFYPPTALADQEMIPSHSGKSLYGVFFFVVVVF